MSAAYTAVPNDLVDAIKSGETEKAMESLSEGAWEVNNPITLHGDALVHEACRHGHLETVKMLTEMGADIEKEDRYGRTPVLVAAMANCSKVVLALVTEFGCNVNAKRSCTTTTLHEVCKFGHLELAIVLIGRGADIHQKDSSGCTPALVAAKENHDNVAIALITEFGSDVNDRDFSGVTLLHLACIHGNMELLHTLITNKWFNLNSCIKPGSDRRTPLFHAIRNKHEKLALKLVRELKLAALYDPNASCKGMPILHMACAMGLLDLVKTFADDGASINKNDIHGNTPLVWAVRYRRNDIVMELLARDSNPNISTKYGATALDEAYKINDTSISNTLESYSAKGGISENSPLVLAIRHKKYEVVKKLLSKNNTDMLVGMLYLHLAVVLSDTRTLEILLHHYFDAKIDAKKNGDLIFKRNRDDPAYDEDVPESKNTLIIKSGNTLLHTACSRGHTDMLKVLLHHDPKAKVDIQDSDGNTPLHLACRRGKVDMVKTLLEYCCDPNIENFKGFTPFNEACRSDSHTIIQDLLQKDANSRDSASEPDTDVDVPACPLLPEQRKTSSL